MADYYSILNKFISGLPDNSESNRSIVYQKARATIESQLRAKDPAPSEEAIAAQMAKLDEAIDQIEQENSPAVEEPAAESVAEVASEQATETPPAVEELSVPEPETVGIQPESDSVTTDVAETEVQVSPPSPVEETPATPEPEVVTTTVKEAAEVAVETSATVVEDVVAPVVDSAPEPVIEPAQAGVEAAVDAIAPEEVSTASVSVAEPDVKPAVEAPPVAEVASAAPAADLQSNQPNQPETVSHVPPVDMGAELSSEESSGSGFIGKAIPYVLALAIIGGGGYALWANKEPLLKAMGIDSSELFSSSEETPVEEKAEEEQVQQEEQAAEEEPVQESEQAETVEPEQPAEEEANEVDKEPVRLGSDGEDVDAAPVTPESETASGETEIPLVLDEQPAENAEAETEEPAIEPVEEAEVADADSTTSSEEPVTEPAAPLIGETAFLYEEGSDGSSASRNDGSIEWSLLQESPGEGAPAEAVIQGILDVPDKAVTMTMKLRRNADQALPASHIIELAFNTPESFSGGAIDSIARFVMKPSEAARGEGLVAVPARIDTGLFLIALNNLEQAVDTNKRLLTEMDWIDIPLGYSTGRRALVTVAKGDQGKKIFAEAFADWANR